MCVCVCCFVDLILLKHSINVPFIVKVFPSSFHIFICCFFIFHSRPTLVLFRFHSRALIFFSLSACLCLFALCLPFFPTVVWIYFTFHVSFFVTWFSFDYQHAGYFFFFLLFISRFPFLFHSCRNYFFILFVPFIINEKFDISFCLDDFDSLFCLCYFFHFFSFFLSFTLFFAHIHSINGSLSFHFPSGDKSKLFDSIALSNKFNLLQIMKLSTNDE